MQVRAGPSGRLFCFPTDFDTKKPQRKPLTENPVSLTQPPKKKRSTGRTAWSVDEARRLLAANRDHRRYARFHFGLVTGIRRGEGDCYRSLNGRRTRSPV